jgi:hypothetical protein
MGSEPSVRHNTSGVGKGEVREPKSNHLSGLSQTSASLMDSEEGWQTVYRWSVGVMIYHGMLHACLESEQ